FPKRPMATVNPFTVLENGSKREPDNRKLLLSRLKPPLFSRSVSDNGSKSYITNLIVLFHLFPPRFIK
ncbi:hypothetical protein PanWU01x14_139970, partial [Parasponia andersonii]